MSSNELVEETVKVPSEAEGLLLVLKQISTKLRDAEENHKKMLLRAEDESIRVAKRTHVKLERAEATIRRVRRYKFCGPRNKRLLEQAENMVKRIKEARQKAYDDRIKPSQEQLDSLRFMRNQAIADLLALAEPDPKPE